MFCSSGLDRFCRLNQSDPCYAALGHKLNLLNPSKNDTKIRKKINSSATDPVCRVKNGKMKENECDLYRNRSEVTVINGTLIINRVIRADSGNYTVSLSLSQTAQKHLQFFKWMLKVQKLSHQTHYNLMFSKGLTLSNEPLWRVLFMQRIIEYLEFNLIHLHFPCSVLSTNIGTLGKYEKRRLWK